MEQKGRIFWFIVIFISIISMLNKLGFEFNVFQDILISLWGSILITIQIEIVTILRELKKIIKDKEGLK